MACSFDSRDQGRRGPYPCVDQQEPKMLSVLFLVAVAVGCSGQVSSTR